MVSAHATELILAVPSDITDIYELHQTVWSQVQRYQLVDHRPRLLYRRDGGMIRVRVMDCAMKTGCGVSASTSFSEGQLVEWKVSIALWRDTVSLQLKEGAVPDRIVDLLTRAGVDIEAMEYSVRLAHGEKKGMSIDLPVADVRVFAKLVSPLDAKLAWEEGIGRGRRFGFGMIAAA
jgi:hypothetical protein